MVIRIIDIGALFQQLTEAVGLVGFIMMHRPSGELRHTQAVRQQQDRKQTNNPQLMHTLG